MNNSPKQRKTTALLTQFFMFFLVAAAGIAAGIVSEDVSYLLAIILVIAVAVAIYLITLTRRIQVRDNSKFWVGCTIAAFAIAALFSLGLIVEEPAFGVFAFGLIGLICTTVHFLLWKVVKFFRDNSSSMPGTPHKGYKVRDLSKEARAYISRFDALYAEIPKFKQPIARQVKHIRNAYMQVHDFVSKNPESKSGTHELMDYHFPQALKLLETYRDFTKKKVKVDNIKQILDNIVQSFDTLVKAVDTQLNNLYAGKVLDIKTDMAVMKNLK
jgi:5-bromo-4-chloroindolyl phosphate hydrolysis protein